MGMCNSITKKYINYHTNRNGQNIIKGFKNYFGLIEKLDFSFIAFKNNHLIIRDHSCPPKQ